MDLVPDDREPTAAAELVIETGPAGDPDAGDADRTEIRKPRWLRWLPASVRVRIIVPGGTTLVVMLEIVVPPLTFRRPRWR